MDIWGIGITLSGLALYFATGRKHKVFIFVSGVGAGILIGAIWAMAIVSNVLR